MTISPQFAAAVGGFPDFHQSLTATRTVPEPAPLVGAINASRFTGCGKTPSPVASSKVATQPNTAEAAGCGWGSSSNAAPVLLFTGYDALLLFPTGPAATVSSVPAELAQSELSVILRPLPPSQFPNQTNNKKVSKSV